MSEPKMRKVVLRDAILIDAEHREAGTTVEVEEALAKRLISHGRATPVDGDAPASDDDDRSDRSKGLSTSSAAGIIKR